MARNEQAGESAAEEMQPKEALDSALAGPDQRADEPVPAEKDAQPDEEAWNVSAAESISSVPEPQSERQGRSRLRRGLYSLVALLVAFLLGVGVVALLLYRPAQQELDEAEQQLVQAERRIGELEDQIAALEPIPAQLDEATAQLRDAERTVSILEDQVASLEPVPAQLDHVQRHVAVLGVLADVNAARLALVGGDTSSARLYLSVTPDRLDQLAKALGATDEAVISAMQKRLDLIVKGISRDPKLAQADLEALANQLMQLEMTFLEMP